METVIPYLLTNVYQVSYERERLELDDGDFLDLDWMRNGHSKLMVISHGFEGNSHDPYVEKTAANFSQSGYDVLVWHYRSCSRELNRLPRFYDQGDIGDFESVIRYAILTGYKRISLVGFSFGGSMVINYLANGASRKDIESGVVFSVPLDLEDSSNHMRRGLSRLIEQSFFKKWKRKIEQKAILFPEKFDRKKIASSKSLEELLDSSVIPIHGYHSIDDYYNKWSSIQFIDQIKKPLLIVNAKNDPLLSKNCYPSNKCEQSEHVYLEAPIYGGHLGFSKKKERKLWYIWRIAQFLGEAENL